MNKQLLIWWFIHLILDLFNSWESSEAQGKAYKLHVNMQISILFIINFFCGLSHILQLLVFLSMEQTTQTIPLC